jgi:hypothetical protein
MGSVLEDSRHLVESGRDLHFDQGEVALPV